MSSDNLLNFFLELPNKVTNKYFVISASRCSKSLTRVPRKLNVWHQSLKCVHASDL